MVVLGGHGGQWCGGSTAVCRHFEPWEVVQEEVIGILVEARLEAKGSKIPILATVGYTSVLFWVTLLSSNGRDRARAAVSGAAGS